MKFSVPFIFGIIYGWNVSVPTFPLLIISVVFISFYIAFLRVPSWNNLSVPILIISITFLGILKITFDSRMLSEDNVSNYVYPDRIITLYGSVSDLPRVSDQSVRFTVDADSLRINNSFAKVSGSVFVSALKKNVDISCLHLFTYGKNVALHGELATIRTARNPGEFDMRRYLNLNNIYARFSLDRLDSAMITETMENTILTLIVYPVRRSITGTIDTLFKDEIAQFLKGLLVGERSEIPLEVKTSFINSGVMHILAVSGLHVAIVTFILIIILQVLRFPEKMRIILTCILLVYYNYLTGGTPSVTRSVIMAVVFLGAKLLERKSDMYNTLALSAALLLLIDSRQLFQPGFQLSFAAVLSIVYLYPKIYHLKNLFPHVVRENRIIVAIFALIAVSVAAGVGTLPFTSLYFGKISIISFVANLIIVPLSNVILALGMIAVAMAYLSFWLASIYAEATSSLTWLLLMLVDYFGNLPFAYIELRISIWSSLIFYAGILVVVTIGRKQVREKAIILSLIVLNVWLYGFNIFRPSEGLLRVTFLDVGQGDAIFIEYPDGNNMLVDAGPRSYTGDAGARFISPFLKYNGISSLHTLLVSHPDADHLGGVPMMLRNFKVKNVIDNGSPSQSSLCSEYLFVVDSLKLKRMSPHTGMQISDNADTRLYILHSSEKNSAFTGKHISQNNQSIVLKIVYGLTSLMLMGDAESETEALLLKSYGSFLKSDVLKVAHHGSETGTSMSYLRTVQPGIAVISVGVKNKFGHPSRELLQRLQKNGCQYYRTDELGAVVLESDGEKWSVINWH